MTESTKHAIIEASADGKSVREIASEVGASKSAVGRVVERYRERIDLRRVEIQHEVVAALKTNRRKWIKARMADICDSKSRSAPRPCESSSRPSDSPEAHR